MGVRLRTTLTATAAVAAALCLAAVALFTALDTSLAQSTEASAQQDAKQRAMAELRAQAQEKGTATPPYAVPGSPVKAPGAFPSGPSGIVIQEGGSPGGANTGRGIGTGTSPGAGDVQQIEALGGRLDGKWITTKDPGGKAVVVSTVLITGKGAVTVRGTAPTAPARAAMATLTDVLAPGVPALLALVALATWFAVGRALRPVSAIREKVADITAHDLHERVPEPRTRDEIAALARTVNATLDRLRTAVDAHRQFVADAAHELRSPMAVLRTRLELAAPAEKELAGEALADVARLQSLTSDLLLLARLDAHAPLRVGEVDLAQLVAEEAACRRPRTDVRVTLDITPDVRISGSADHLRRLVANLVDNAVRHATAGVTVRLTRTPGHAVLDVTDDGPGIPAEHRATVFERFTRLDHARTRDTGGSGLGLPIARDIAAAHHGTLAVQPGGQGAHLRAAFPLRRERAQVPWRVRRVGGVSDARGRGRRPAAGP